jgi:MFS family permease
MSESLQDRKTGSYVAAHGVAQLLFWSAFYYLLPALSVLIASQTDWPVVHISTTYTLAFLVWAFCAPMVGHWIDRGYGVKVIRAGAIVGITLLIALSQITDRWMFSGIVVLMGGCMAATLYDPCFAVIMRRLELAGSHAVASVTLIAGFATLLTFPLVFWLSMDMTWQQIVLIFAGLAALGVFLLPADARVWIKQDWHAEKVQIEKGPALIAVSFGLVMLGHSILLFLLPVALTKTQGTVNVALLALAILGPAQIAGRLVWKFFASRINTQNFAIAMFACLCLPALILLMFGAATFPIYLALSVQGGCYGVHTIIRPILAQQYLSPRHLGRGLGMIAMVGLFMMAIGPAIGGLIWSHWGLSGLMGALLSLNVVALLLGLVLRKTIAKGAMI